MNNRTFYIIGTILLIAIIAVAGYSVAQRNTQIKTQAESPTTPIDLRISEISQSSFTIEWETEADFSGYVLYGIKPEELNAVGIDQKGTYKFKNHIIILEDLQPETTYYYAVVSEEDTYFSEGNPFEIKTLK